MIHFVLAVVLLASPTGNKAFVTTNFKQVEITPSGEVSIKEASVRGNAVLMPSGNWLEVAKAKLCETASVTLKNGGMYFQDHLVSVHNRRIDSVSQVFENGSFVVVFCGTSARSRHKPLAPPFHSTGDVVVFERSQAIARRYQLSPGSPVSALCEE